MEFHSIPMSQVAFENLSILIVDDSKNMRIIIRSMLKAFGAKTVFEAENGAEGFDIMREVNPDLAIVDLKMPILDGFQFTKTVRESDCWETSSTPIIILSAFSEKKLVMAAHDAGIDAFLCKPISATTLYSRVQHVIEHPRSFVGTNDYFERQRRTPSFSTEEESAETIPSRDVAEV